MSFNPNKTPIEIIREGAFGGTYFRDIYSGVNGKWYRNSWKEFNFLEDIDPKLYASNYYDAKLINIKSDAVHLYDFGKIKDGFMNKILTDGFNGIVDII